MEQRIYFFLIQTLNLEHKWMLLKQKNIMIINLKLLLFKNNDKLNINI